MPPSVTSIGTLSKAIDKLMENPLPAKLTPPIKELLHNISRDMPFYKKMVFSNTWFFGPLIKVEYEKSAAGNACIRTTTAPTIFNSGVKENVLPSSSTAIVNFRILPGESSSYVTEFVKQTIDNDSISIKMLGEPIEPSEVSDISNEEYKILQTCIFEHYRYSHAARA